VNNVTYSWKYITVLRLKDCNFVTGLLFVINKKYGIVKGFVLIKFKISNVNLKLSHHGCT